MLPTLNLQLFPLDTLDDAAVSAAPLLAEAGGEAESGFADLLRLRVDAALATETPGGQFLPQSGSPLPIQADFAPAEPGADTLSLSTIDPGQTLKTTDSAAEISLLENLESTDIVLEAAVLYGPLDRATGNEAEALTASLQVPGTAAPLSVSIKPQAEGQVPSVTVTPSAINSGPPAAAVLDGSRVVTPRPATLNASIALAETGPDAMVDKAALSPPTGTGLREQGPLRDLQSRIAAINVTNAGVDVQERQPPGDLVRHLDLGPVQRREGFAETVGEPLSSRILTPQVGHATPAQPATANAQVPLSSVHTASTPLNNPYTATATGATDFIGTSVRESAWGDQLNARVVMMAGNQLKTAEIRLTPAELGPLRVQVAVDDGAAHVTFHAQHAVTREAIEQALPRLREMLAENGLALGQTDVSDRGVGEGTKDGAAEQSPSRQATDDLHDGGADADRQLVPQVTMSDALVDTFA